MGSVAEERVVDYQRRFLPLSQRTRTKNFYSLWDVAVKLLLCLGPDYVTRCDMCFCPEMTFSVDWASSIKNHRRARLKAKETPGFLFLF